MFIENVISTFPRLRDMMNDAMCHLMHPDSDGNKEDTMPGGPRPTLEMNQELFLPVVTRTSMYHYFGCAHREMRDCFLHRTALAMVDKVLDQLTHIDVNHLFGW